MAFSQKGMGEGEAGSSHSMDKCLQYTNKCGQCDEAFSTEKNLKKHIRIRLKCLQYTALVIFDKTKINSCAKDAHH